MGWLLEDIESTEVTAKMREKAKAAIWFVVMASLSEDMRARFPDRQNDMPIKKRLEIINNNFLDRSEEYLDRLRTAARKIKLTPGTGISEYISKHRILRKDIEKAGCDEVLVEQDIDRTTVHYILNGLDKNSA